jgi:hypothetical protein
MGGAVPPLPQCAFTAWCSVRGSTGCSRQTTDEKCTKYLVGKLEGKKPVARNRSKLKNNILDRS